MDNQNEDIHIPTNQEEREQMIRPGFNVNALMWSLLLGLPGLLVFLILQKQAGI